MQQVDDPPFIAVGTEVSAKYKGAFCEAKVSKVVRNIKVRVAYKQGLGTGIVSDDSIKASAVQLRVGAVVEVRHPDRKEYVEATITKIQDSSQYTVVFDDGDITTLRRSALCMKSGRHFNESETLDQLPLTHPEHFGNPVVGGRRGRRRAQLNGDSSEEDEESDAKEVVEKEEDVGKVILFEPETKKKEKEKWFPGLVVSPTAQATERIRVKDEYLVRSFKDGRYYTVPKKEAIEFPRQFSGAQQNSPAFQAALRYLDSNVLPPHWDRDTLFAISNTSSCEDVDIDSDSSEDEPSEEKDRFVAQLYKFMDDRGTPLNKSPSIHNRDIDLYRLFRAVQKRGGYNRVSSKNQWKHIVVRLGFVPVTQSVKTLVKQAYKKFLQPYCEFNRKLGCSLLMPSSRTGRGKGRSLLRANSVASPKTVDAGSSKSININTSSTPPVPTTSLVSTAGQQSGTEESGNLSESSVDTLKNKKKTTKAKPVIIKEVLSEINIKNEPIETVKEDSPAKELKQENLDIKDEGDIPLSKIKAAAATVASTASLGSISASSTVTAVAPVVTLTSTSATTSNSGSGASSVSSRSSDDNKEKKSIASIKEEKSKNESFTRETSPSDRSLKKDKHQRKQTPQSDDKRSKRRRDEISVDSYGSGESLIEVNDKLQVYYHEKKTYECKVLEITLQRATPMYLVHYTGWNTRYDEWVPFERIAENITKGTKFKTRFSSNSEKNKDKDKNSHASKEGGNVANTSAGSNSSAHNIGSSKSLNISLSSSSTMEQSKSQSSLVKRGRGRSDSFPPRSTTPSSGASNSSRTKSPATSNSLKKRQSRASSSTSRKATASANASDVSMLTDDSDSDSDEPVRRPKRKSKDAPYKGKSSSSKSSNKSKQNSANHSGTDSENDDEDEDGTSSSIRTLSRSASDIGSKGRDYDLNQIRSELKGFRDLKTPPASNTPSTIDSNNSLDELKIKTELDYDDRRSVSSTEMKTDIKEDIKEELTDSSTGIDSLADDDSQSSDKTTTLKNMTKKFQQKIIADKQRSFEKIKNISTKFTISERSFSNSIVEKIIKDSQAETKRHETLKTKTPQTDDTKVKKNQDPENIFKSTFEVNKKHSDSKEEDKKSSSFLIETKSPTSSSAPMHSSSSNNSTKNVSVVLEKPSSYSKKANLLENSKTKKSTDIHAHKISTADHLSKKLTESALSQKDLLKLESQPAGSPCSSSSSSSSSFGTSSSVHSARSLPDMSKLEISGSSSSSPCSSIYAPLNKDLKYSPPKANSPDIYEFKDPEPFEYEVRKSPLVSSISHSQSSTATSAMSQTTSGSSHSRNNSAAPGVRKTTVSKLTQPNTSIGNTAGLDHHQGPTMTSFLKIGKKRGSPYKEANIVEKSKHSKNEDKPLSTSSTSSSLTSSIVADAKLVHHSSHSSSETQKPPSKQSINQNKTHTTSSGESTVISSKVVMQISSTNAPSAPVTTGTTNQQVLHQKIKEISSASSTSLTSNTSAFDTLRKSGNTNLNINALNEELATAKRALTDVLLVTPASPVQLESQPIKTELVTPIKQEATSPTVFGNSSSTSSCSSSFIKTNLQSTPKFPVSTLDSKSPVTPPQSQTVVKKPIIGSPFIETRTADLSNVFELSSNDGTTMGSKEQKFELENAKILLSSSAGGAFDLKPVNYENKPTSIADKVLKAISQKKEVENKQKETSTKNDSESNNKDKELQKDKEPKTVVENSPPIGLTASIKDLGTMSQSVTITSSTDPLVLPSVASSMEPLKINTDLASLVTKMPLISAGSEKLPNKRSSLASPECKSIFESKPVQKSDLSETIQKLESAIQRKTPIAGLTTSNATTPTPSSVPTMDTFSDDSTDSTDSERRLVIEDIGEDQQESQKSPIVSSLNEGSKDILTAAEQADKLESTEGAKIITSNIVTKPQGIQTPIPLKISPTPQKTTTSSNPIPDISITSNTPLKVADNVPQNKISLSNSSLISPQHITMANIKGISSPISLQYVSSATPSTSGPIATVVPVKSFLPETRKEDITLISRNRDSSGVTNLQVPMTGAQISLIPKVLNPQQRSDKVGPAMASDNPTSVTILPDTPTQTLQTIHPQTSPTISSQKMCSIQPVNSNISSIQNIPVPTISSHMHQTTTIRVTSTEPLQQVLLSKSTLQKPQVVLAPSTSGFYLNPHKELRPEDGVTPLEAQTPPMQEKLRSAPILQEDSISSGKATNPQSQAINLLCEESIPGSPPPLSNDDETPPTTTSELQLTPLSSRNAPSENPNERNLTNTQSNSLPSGSAQILSIPATPAITNAPAASLSHQTSSPNDSASQDESGEDFKKHMDIENDTSPRKRRRTRKQSDVASVGEQHSKKRKQHLSSFKKNAGSDSEDYSDMTSQRSQAARQIIQPQQQQPILQPQQQNYTGIKPCPYNFLVHIDPALPPEQSIEIIQKQMNEIRKTYNMLKNNLASIDRRRKKYRRREREKKQMHMQQQQSHQIKISS